VGLLLDFLNAFTSPPKLPTVMTILPQAAVIEIQSGRLPQLNTSTIFLKSGEICHYIDKAILLKEKSKKSYVRRSNGTSVKGFFGMRHNVSRGRTDVEEQIFIEQFRGILYITNKRVIFQATKNGFEKPLTSLTSIAPYSNAVELQYGSAGYSLLVPNGVLIQTVLNLLH
jgi:hypothetical protein